MYFVGLSGIKGYDTVVWSSITGYRPGDLLQDNTGVFLCIGKEIIFAELYEKQRKKEYVFINPTKAYKQLISKSTLDIIHWMVQEYFSSYKHVVGLYIPHGIEGRLPKKPVEGKDIEQTCIIFPDLRTLTQTHKYDLSDSSIAILHGGMTIVQRIKLFWGIRQGSIQTLLATNRGLFFDWCNLKHITIYNPSSWAYSGQSEPRFVIKETVDKVATIYKSTVEYKI